MPNVPTTDRRHNAALTVAEEQDGIDPLPCAAMEAGNDAAALEASLIENIARLDTEEVRRPSRDGSNASS